MAREPLPKVGVQASLRKVCLQPKGRQEFTPPFAELVPMAKEAETPLWIRLG